MAAGAAGAMRARTASHRWRLAVRLSVAALVWSLGLVLAGLFARVYSTSSTSDVNGVTLSGSTLVQVNGIRALVLMAVPLVASVVVAWALRARRAGARRSTLVAWSAVAVVAAETVVGMMSIGVFILPVTVLLALAVRAAPSPGARSDVRTADRTAQL
jgi:hypothetical protein